MKRISDYLDRFRTLEPRTVKKDLFAQIVSDATGCRVSPESVGQQGNRIHLDLHPAVLTEVLRKEKEILAAYNERTRQHLSSIH